MNLKSKIKFHIQMLWIGWPYSNENQDTLRKKEGAIINFSLIWVLIRTLLDKIGIIVIIDMNNLNKWTPNFWLLVDISVWFRVLTSWGICIVLLQFGEELPDRCSKEEKNNYKHCILFLLQAPE